MEEYKVTFGKPITRQKNLLRRIAEEEGGYVITQYGDSYVIIRNEYEPSNEDEVFGVFDSNVSDIGLGIMRNSVEEVTRI